MLGGENGKELFILTAGSSDPQFCKENKTGEIYKVEVNYERAGEP
jgi:sugar lactone lactonase YvrE